MSTVSSEIRIARRSGAVDSVMFSHSDLISRWAVLVFESWVYIFFFNFWLCYVSFMSNIFSTVLLNGFLIGRLFDRKPDKLLQML